MLEQVEAIPTLFPPSISMKQEHETVQAALVCWSIKSSSASAGPALGSSADHHFLAELLSFTAASTVL